MRALAQRARRENGHYRAERIIEGFKVHLRNGGLEKIERGDRSQLDDALRSVRRIGTLNRAAHDRYCQEIRELVRAALTAPRTMVRQVDLLATSVEAARRKARLRHV